MLSEDDKSRIRREEIFRQQVQLEARSSQKSKMEQFWVFLNSPVCIFLMSSVLITGLGTLYTSFQAKQAIIRESAELARKLEIELHVRFQRISADLSRPLPDELEICNMTDRTGGISSEDYEVFPEFDKRQMFGLVFEFATVSPEKGGSFAAQSEKLLKLLKLLRTETFGGANSVACGTPVSQEVLSILTQAKQEMAALPWQSSLEVDWTRSTENRNSPE